MQPNDGTIISGLIKSVTDEMVGGRMRRTTRRYDPLSSPPVEIECTEMWFWHDD